VDNLCTFGSTVKGSGDSWTICAGYAHNATFKKWTCLLRITMQTGTHIVAKVDKLMGQLKPSIICCDRVNWTAETDSDGLSI